MTAASPPSHSRLTDLLLLEDSAADRELAGRARPKHELMPHVAVAEDGVVARDLPHVMRPGDVERYERAILAPAGHRIFFNHLGQ